MSKAGASFSENGNFRTVNITDDPKKPLDDLFENIPVKKKKDKRCSRGDSAVYRVRTGLEEEDEFPPPPTAPSPTGEHTHKRATKPKEQAPFEVNEYRSGSSRKRGPGLTKGRPQPMSSGDLFGDHFPAPGSSPSPSSANRVFNPANPTREQKLQMQFQSLQQRDTEERQGGKGHLDRTNTMAPHRPSPSASSTPLPHKPSSAGAARPQFPIAPYTAPATAPHPQGGGVPPPVRDLREEVGQTEDRPQPSPFKDLPQEGMSLKEYVDSFANTPSEAPTLDNRPLNRSRSFRAGSASAMRESEGKDTTIDNRPVTRQKLPSESLDLFLPERVDDDTVDSDASDDIAPKDKPNFTCLFMASDEEFGDEPQFPSKTAAGAFRVSQVDWDTAFVESEGKEKEKKKKEHKKNKSNKPPMNVISGPASTAGPNADVFLDDDGKERSKARHDMHKLITSSFESLEVDDGFADHLSLGSDHPDATLYDLLMQKPAAPLTETLPTPKGRESGTPTSLELPSPSSSSPTITSPSPLTPSPGLREAQEWTKEGATPELGPQALTKRSQKKKKDATSPSSHEGALQGVTSPTEEMSLFHTTSPNATDRPHSSSHRRFLKEMKEMADWPSELGDFGDMMTSKDSLLEKSFDSFRPVSAAGKRDRGESALRRPTPTVNAKEAMKLAEARGLTNDQQSERAHARPPSPAKLGPPRVGSAKGITPAQKLVEQSKLQDPGMGIGTGTDPLGGGAGFVPPAFIHDLARPSSAIGPRPKTGEFRAVNPSLYMASSTPSESTFPPDYPERPPSTATGSRRKEVKTPFPRPPSSLTKKTKNGGDGEDGGGPDGDFE